MQKLVQKQSKTPHIPRFIFLNQSFKEGKRRLGPRPFLLADVRRRRHRRRQLLLFPLTCSFLFFAWAFSENANASLLFPRLLFVVIFARVRVRLSRSHSRFSPALDRRQKRRRARRTLKKKKKRFSPRRRRRRRKTSLSFDISPPLSPATMPLSTASKPACLEHMLERIGDAGDNDRMHADSDRTERNAKKLPGRPFFLLLLLLSLLASRFSLRSSPTRPQTIKTFFAPFRSPPLS